MIAPKTSNICGAIYKAEVITPKGELKKAFWFDKVILTSGKVSVMYVDHRTICADPEVYGSILRGFLDNVKPLNPKFIVSSAEAGNFWGASVASTFYIGFAYLSKKD